MEPYLKHIRRDFLKHSTFSITIFLLTLSVVIADTPKEHHAKEHHDCPAPIGVMGEHQS